MSNSTRWIKFYLVTFCLVFSCKQCAQVDAQGTTLFQNVNVFDGEKKNESTNVLIVDGKIHTIGQEVVAPENAKTIDGTGKTLMPGMIDCHTHVWFEAHLRQAAIFGVTTELDMMSTPTVGKTFRDQQKEGAANGRADFYSAGSAVTVKGGHGTQFGFPVPTLDKVENTAQFVRERVAEGSDYIKLIYEDGSAYGSTLPTISTAMFAESVKIAHALDKLAVSHVSTLSSATMAVENQINGLVHLFSDARVTDDFIELSKKSKIFIVPTTAVVSNVSGSNSTKQLVNDANIKALLNNQNQYNLNRTFPKISGSKLTWEKLQFNIRKLHEAGIPILAGTDAPNPGTVHGASMHHELRLLTQCGLSNEQALAAATSLPAKHFKLDDRGRIAKGLRADLILLDGDPTEDVSNVAKIVGVWKSGHPIERQTRKEEVLAEVKRAEELKSGPDGEERLISNFDGAEIVTEFGAGWKTSSDSMMGGDSTVEMKLATGGAKNSNGCLELSGKTRAQQPAFAGVMFSPNNQQTTPEDLSANKSLSFWSKSEAKDFQVMLFFQKRGFQPSTKTIKASKEWKQHRFDFADFDGCDGTDVIGIWFGQATPGEFKFQIDEITLGN